MRCAYRDPNDTHALLTIIRTHATEALKCVRVLYIPCVCVEWWDRRSPIVLPTNWWRNRTPITIGNCEGAAVGGNILAKMPQLKKKRFLKKIFWKSFLKNCVQMYKSISKSPNMPYAKPTNQDARIYITWPYKPIWLRYVNYNQHGDAIFGLFVMLTSMRKQFFTKLLQNISVRIHFFSTVVCSSIL